MQGALCVCVFFVPISYIIIPGKYTKGKSAGLLQNFKVILKLLQCSLFMTLNDSIHRHAFYMTLLCPTEGLKAAC